jgi:hypothetical protein
MPTATRAARVYNLTLTPRGASPLLSGWNRLEGRPRSADFARSLRAEVRDPVWFLTRQWQYGEFEGEDAGSPIDARIAYRTSTLDGYTAGDATLPYDPTTPVEVRVEREAVPFDLVLHMQAARVFERLLGDRGVAARLSDYVRTFPLDYDTGIAGAAAADSRALFESGKSFLFDAARLLAAVRDGSHATRLAGFHGLTANERTKLLDAGDALLQWHLRTYAQPAGEPAAWRPDILGYTFACSASAAGARLNANHHRGGELDWYAFDVDSSAEPVPAAEQQSPVTLSFLPAAIRFSGMPSTRYWEIEDSRTDLSSLDVNANDVARLLFTEFVLLFSNDWCLLPLELVVGSFTRIDGIVVTDVFGDRTLVRAADRGTDSDWQRWSMYRLNGDDSANMGLLLAPALTAKMEAPPLEQVHFLRDEMANMVWAVEHRVASKAGEPLDPAIGYVQPQPAGSARAGARYRLGETVPPNWRPFIPAHVPGSLRSIRLQRARIPSQSQQPLGTILDVPSPYFVAEEEVPRGGRKVTRAFQRARWIDGSTFLWIGRSAPFGRGEGSSGLVFDNIEETRTSETRDGPP